MHGRLYEVIRDYQRHRAATIGGTIPEFRERALVDFAANHPERYPEYWVDPAWLSRAIAEARASGEILSLGTGSRDEQLVLRQDRRPAT